MQTGKKEKNMGEKRVRNEMEGNEERRRIKNKEETRTRRNKMQLFNDCISLNIWTRTLIQQLILES